MKTVIDRYFFETKDIYIYIYRVVTKRRIRQDACYYHYGSKNEAEFLIYSQHFKKYTSSNDHKVLLLLDNQASHISIEALDFCKENGIIVL